MYLTKKMFKSIMSYQAIGNLLGITRQAVRQWGEDSIPEKHELKLLYGTEKQIEVGKQLMEKYPGLILNRAKHDTEVSK